MSFITRRKCGRSSLPWISALCDGRSHKTPRPSFARSHDSNSVVQGTRDSLCPLDLLERVRSEMKAPNFLHLVEGGDHSLRAPKRLLQASGQTQEDIDQQIFRAIAEFVDGLIVPAD